MFLAKRNYFYLAKSRDLFLIGAICPHCATISFVGGLPFLHIEGIDDFVFL